ncbi:hypothetical protein AAHA92_24860 [Salvia divinorum]|uniref:KIB1-4 beta-propeller domain-containing protein n=1 Tax=Salvia divinorum TaxID=28513 RepID=A0ABD1G8R5_SALDI
MSDFLHCRVLTHGPTARTRIINPLDLIPYLICVVSPNGPTSGLTVVHTVPRTLPHDVYWDTNVSVWYECNTSDPFDSKKKKMEFVSMVCFHDNYYAMSLQGAIAVMQVVDTRLLIKALGPTRAIPRSSWRFFKEYLFEMNGEILLVFLIHRESLAVVDHVEIFRLDLVGLDWIKVERLRGKTVFLKKRCVWVDSKEFGCDHNRVYFTEGLEKNWKVFHMKSCCISPVSYGCS